jgi:hypothetical protein
MHFLYALLFARNFILVKSGCYTYEEVGTRVRDKTDAGGGEAPAAGSENEDAALGGGGSDDSADADASDNESSHTYCLSTSTITLGRIREMAEKGYFVEGQARAAGEEMIPGPQEDEAVIFEDFFVVVSRMPPHPALADILLKFQALLHQLMPNAIA